MKTETIIVSSLGQGIKEALALTEKLGKENGLEKKEVLHLRLLAEELFGMLRSITGELEADYRLDAEGKNFVLRLTSDVILTEAMRQQLISASTSGLNAAAKGVMGKIRVMIAEALLPKTGPSVIMPGLSLGLMSMASPTGQSAGLDAYMWSLNKYKAEVEGREEGGEAWDELEKSIVANVADEVSVSIVGSKVEIAVYKSF